MHLRHRLAALATAALVTGSVLTAATSAAHAAPPAPQRQATTAGSLAYCNYYFGSTTVRRGSRGDAVAEVQCIINYWYGHRVLEEDGIFGQYTESWVKDFQRYNGIAIDGIVGPVTWSYLRAV
ncbi:peptidoglycan-binding domain-containing protein [Streptomyces sp. NPDC091371]|uniref:peptidoglycan-binding domain-containing protein n=1 Tax=Streptomyces sp. NPDC091371 TaxID=3155303 RepID=UPI0034222690